MLFCSTAQQPRSVLRCSRQHRDKMTYFYFLCVTNSVTKPTAAE